MFRKILLGTAVCTTLVTISTFAQVGIGTTTPNAAAALDINSTSKALILPRLNTAAINGIPAPVPGMVVYNMDSSRFWGYGGVGSSTLISQPQQNATYYSTAAVGQSFSAPSTFDVDAVDLYVLAAFPTTLTLSIRSGSGNAGPVLATNTTSVPGSGIVPAHFVFPGGVTLQNGSTYTLSVSPSGPSAGGPLEVVYAGNNPYPSGAFYAGTTLISGFDASFNIYKIDYSWHKLD